MEVFPYTLGDLSPKILLVLLNFLYSGWLSFSLNVLDGISWLKSFQQYLSYIEQMKV